jgi:hypothetical protein
MSGMGMKGGNLTMVVNGKEGGVVRAGSMDRDGGGLGGEDLLLLEGRDSCVVREWRGVMCGWQRWRC